MLERTLRLNFLYDFYQSLLTERQREYMKLYYFNDFSLAEISEVTNVSRQAVYDNLKRTEKTLESYEEKLSLYKKYEQRMKILSNLEDLTDREEILRLVCKLKELS